MIQTTQNLDLFDKNLYNMLTISEIIVSAVLKKFLYIKQQNASTFYYSKNYGSLTLKPSLKFKVALNMGDLPRLFGDSS